MKKNKKEKFKASLKRTALGVLLMVIAVLYLGTAIHWKTWTPNDDWGVIMVISLYAGGIILLLYGFYLLSPMYIGVFVHIMLDEFCRKTRVSRLSQEEIEENEAEEKRFLKEIRDMKKRYLW